MTVHPKSPKYAPKSYEQTDYPDQRREVDVKIAPYACLVNRQVAGE